MLPVYSNGSRVDSSTSTNSGTLQKLTLSNIDKGSSVFWCALHMATKQSVRTACHLQALAHSAQAVPA